MSAYETIKNELKIQKEKIINKGGKVIVKNDYPSPSEITAGIETITTPDYTVTTATEDDVLNGKTFYSMSAELKTGKGNFDPNIPKYVFLYKEQTRQTNEKVYFNCPQGVEKIKTYQFQYNHNPIHFTFNSDLLKISDYAFYEAKNTTFAGFDELTQITDIGQYSFYGTKGIGMNFVKLPNTVTTISAYAFNNVFNEEYVDYRFPNSLINLGNSVYRQTDRRLANSLDLTNYQLTSFSNNLFQNLAFNCNCNIPEGVKTINQNFNYNGSFKNVEIPSTITKLDNNCFGSGSSEPLSNFFLTTVTINKETPPTFGTNVFASQHMQNGFKIYVPDVAVEAYKAVSNLQKYIDYIYPISEKD